VFEVQDARDKSLKALKVVRPGIYVKDAKIEEAVLRRMNEID